MRCAIRSTSPLADVVLWVGSVDNQAAVDRTASFCTQLIASGGWFGVANDASPANYGYAGVGSIQLSPITAINVWSRPDYGSTEAAYAFIETFRLNGFPVYD